ncbi:hypothetical protein H1W37_06415 [Stappia taiwanensis]|uniref:Uncharacterized protein n=1 Tax=Stappia taiwanensis TaxID=992267 RepID=A0A838XL91_9HYPH|nr:hypothetical protein [Stappia taiwanensis]MBA4611275.1 hypothetical protein [Stappia taiwanensis]GGE87310.1 hypothetical protein GCM10007285_13670 [Stappia taiwanensis]
MSALFGGAGQTIPQMAWNHIPVASLDQLGCPASQELRLLRQAVGEGPDQDAGGAPSDLTPAGAPLEVAFVWPSGELRVSADPCPGAGARARLLSCLSGLTAALSPDQARHVERVAAWQRAHGSRFGGWLGYRVIGGILRSKLYLDVPRGAPWETWEEEVCGRAPVLPSRGLRLSMIGLDTRSGGLELYYRCDRLFPKELDTLLTRLRLPERGGEVVALVAALTRRSIRFELPSYDMGFSYAFDGQGRPQAFTWYSVAEALLGPPDRVREAILRVGRAAGWDQDAYARLTDARAVPGHGLVGAVLAPELPMQVTATVAASRPQGEAGDA